MTHERIAEAMEEALAPDDRRWASHWGSSPPKQACILHPGGGLTAGKGDVDPTNQERNDLGDGAPLGTHKPGRANRPPGEDDRWLRSVLESSSEIMKVVDPDGTLRYASPAFGRILGYDPAEAVGTMNFFDHVHPDDLAHVLEQTEKALLAEGVGTNVVEYRFRHKDGSWRWMEGVGTYLPDDPAVGGIVVNARDVTGRMEAEQALRESEAEVFSVLESITDGFFALDRELRFTYVNSQAALILGRSREDLVGEGLREDPTFYPEYRKALTEGKAVMFEGYYPPLEKWYDVRAYPSASGLSVYFQDVTGRKGAEEALKESEAFVRGLLRNLPNGSVNVFDEDLRYLLAEGRGPEEVGLSPGMLVGKTIVEVFGEEGLGLVEGHYRRAFSGEEVRFELPVGGLVYEIDAAPLHTDEDGEVRTIIAVAQNVTERKEAEERRLEAEERYRALVETVPAVTYTDRAVGTYPDFAVYTSPQIEALVGYSVAEWLDPGRNLWEERLHPEDREWVLAADGRSRATGEPFAEEYRLITKDGRVVWVRDEAALTRNDAGKPLYWQGVLLDVTERKRAEEALRRSEASLAESQRIAHLGTWEWDVATGEVWWSEETYRILGVDPDEGLPLREVAGRAFFAKDQALNSEMIAEALAGHRAYDYEHRIRRPGGEVRWVHSRAEVVRDEGGEPLRMVGTFQDVTERRVLEDRLRHQALHDPLTGLPNRTLFVDRLGQALGKTRRHEGRRVAVLFMDLDNFKDVNDSLGHEAGDLLLTVVAQRLEGCLRTEDTLARFGGDEFVVLVEDTGGPEEAVRVAERIVEGFGGPFRLDGRELYARASIGIATGDARTKTPEDLLRDADTAMYRAKDGGLEYSLFDPAMHERAVGRLKLENDLRRAIQQEEFVVHYQPIVRLDDRSVRGVEALVRWQHPERGLLNPDEFVPIAEESGLVVPMGEAVLGEACQRAKGWQEASPKMPPLVLSVNLSARQLARPDLADTVEGVLRETGLEARCLALDVTETVYVRALEGNTGALSRLRAMGVGVSIDDFGTGYSSLSYLKRLPADAVKIDKSFVRGLGEDIEDTAIVRMVVELAHTFGVEAIAEGVETEEQAELLREMGCDMAQGYLFSKPLPPQDVPGFLAG